MSLTELPKDLPQPEDDGGADHLPGLEMPPLSLLGTDGATVQLDRLPPPRTVIYIYPMTGRPDCALPEGWDAIPGARGCTAQSCALRDHASELRAMGAHIFALSTQDSAYQKEMVARLHLPFSALSDSDLALTHALRLPTMEVEGMTLLRRMTLVIREARIEHVFYPVFPPDRSAEQVRDWLRAHPIAA
ncbi:MAG: peroxiredoxin [Pseudomonadota bacterium]